MPDETSPSTGAGRSVSLASLLDYDRWANARLAETLATAAAAKDGGPESLSRSLAIFAHVLASHRLWQGRCAGDEAQPGKWPSLSPSRLSAEVDACRKGWDAILNGPPEADAVRYTSEQGDSFNSHLSDVVLHVVMHGTYHRGQIAMLLGRGNVPIPHTDLIRARRAGEAFASIAI